ncbi:MAG: ABC transporter substrate-binding protein [Thermoleophilaceae bacterium]
MVPSDLEISRAMVGLAGPAPRRRIAVVETADFAQRELGAVLAAGLRRAGAPPVASVALRDSPDAIPGALDELAAARPDVVLAAGEPGPVTTGLLRGLNRRLPSADLVGSPELAGVRLPAAPAAQAPTAVLPASAQPLRGRRLLARLGPAAPAQALYGYDAMQLVLDAVASAGADREAVVRSALRPRRARGVTGSFRVLRGGEVSRPRLAVVSLTDGRAAVRAPVR